MQVQEITGSLVKAGFKQAVVTGKYVDVVIKEKENRAYAVAVVDCTNLKTITVSEYENVLRGIRSSLYEYSFEGIEILSVLCTGEPDSVKDLVQAFGEHWVVDLEQRKLLIYENQRSAFLNTKEILEQELYKTGEYSVDEERNLGQSYPKENFCTLALVFINVLLFLYTSMTAKGTELLEKGSILPALVGKEFWVYRIFTSMFFHFSVEHLANNVFMLAVMGRYVEKRLPKWKYLTLYFGAGIIGGLTELYSCILNQNLHVICAGASGAIFGLTGALLWMIIKNRGQLEEISWMQMLFLVFMNVYIGLSDTTVANGAHIGGLIGGFVLTMILYQNTDKEELFHEN